MSQGVTDHRNPDNPNKMLAGGRIRNFDIPDPNNPQENGTLPDNGNSSAIFASKDTYNISKLELGEKVRVFVQISAMTNMNPKLTAEFCNKFLFPEKISVPVCNKLMEKYANEVLRATNAVQLFLQTKYDSLSFIAEATIIHNGISFVEKAQKRIHDNIDKWEELYDAEPDTGKDGKSDYPRRLKLFYEQKQIDRATRTMSSLANQYQQWATRRDTWLSNMDNLVIDTLKNTNPNGPETTFLDARKLSVLMKENGVDGSTADRVAAVIVHGDGHSQNMPLEVVS